MVDRVDPFGSPTTIALVSPQSGRLSLHSPLKAENSVYWSSTSGLANGRRQNFLVKRHLIFMIALRVGYLTLRSDGYRVLVLAVCASQTANFTGKPRLRFRCLVLSVAPLRRIVNRGPEVL